MNGFKWIGILAICAELSACSHLPVSGMSANEGAQITQEWRDVAADDLLILRLPKGEVIIELSSKLTPQHAQRMRDAVRAGVYNGEYFYRVIEGHVAQAGVEFDARMEAWPPLKLEAEWPARSHFIPLGNADLFAKEVGHIDGFPAGRGDGKEWLLHCPGAVAMARDIAPDTGTIEFYIPLGPRRYLDRNLTVFGRVLVDMDIIDGLIRAEPADETGTEALLSKDPAIRRSAEAKRAALLAPNRILSATIASDIPPAYRPHYQVMVSGSAAFEDLKTAKRVRTHDFFIHKPPEVLDICAFERDIRTESVRKVK